MKWEEKKEENIKDQPPSTHMINVKVERIMSRVGRCHQEVCLDEMFTKPEVRATEKWGEQLLSQQQQQK